MQGSIGQRQKKRHRRGRKNPSQTRDLKHEAGRGRRESLTPGKKARFEGKKMGGQNPRKEVAASILAAPGAGRKKKQETGEKKNATTTTLSGKRSSKRRGQGISSKPGSHWRRQRSQGTEKRVKKSPVGAQRRREEPMEVGANMRENEMGRKIRGQITSGGNSYHLLKRFKARKREGLHSRKKGIIQFPNSLLLRGRKKSSQEKIPRGGRNLR